MGFSWIVLSASALAAAGAMTASQDNGSAAETRRAYQVGGFDSVSAAGPHKVVVTVGGAASVTASGSAEALEKMEVVVEDGDLEIRPRRGYRYDYKWSDRDRAIFYVTAPRLRAAAVAGSGDIMIDRVEGDSFSGAIAGSGNLDIASLRVSDAKLSIAGSGDLSAKGSAGRSRLSIAGSGNLRLGQVASRRASVSIAGSGNVDIEAAEQVDVSIVGSGDVAVTGSAKCSVTRLGSGQVRCGG